MPHDFGDCLLFVEMFIRLDCFACYEGDKESATRAVGVGIEEEGDFVENPKPVDHS